MSRKQWSKSDIKQFLEVFAPAEVFMDKKSAVAEEDGLLLVKGEPLFFQSDGDWVPTLHALLQKPDLLPSVTVDKGAIKFVVKGADIMRPGITEAQDFKEGDFVVIVDENFSKPLAVGKSLFSSENLLAETGGKVVKNLHQVGDEVWNKK